MLRFPRKVISIRVISLWEIRCSKLGNLEDETFENKLFDQFNSAHIYNKEECRNCWAKFYCSGGCHANAYHANGSILEPYKLGCELEKKRVECAIGIQAVLSDEFEEEGVLQGK